MVIILNRFKNMYNKYSRLVTKDDSQPAAQAMLHAIGLNDEDFDKPFIG